MNIGVGECSPKPFGEYPLVSEKLRDGYSLNGFRSGGGLRVLYFHAKYSDSREDGDVGYGEHPYAEQAMDFLEEDLAAGGREYGDVYGKLHPHFLTGRSTPSSEVDRWILGGNDFDVGYYPDGRFVFQSSGRDSVIPRELYAEVQKTRVPICHVDVRGYIFAVVPTEYPSGEKCVSSRLVEPSYEECRRRGIFDPHEIIRSIWIEDVTLEGLLAKMEAELPKYRRA